MKKFLVVLLALAMVFAIATTAMAADKVIPDYNDTKTSTEYAVDIYRLTALGVLEGNTGWGGAYRPADNLTRAEFAKIACFMFGKQDYKNFYAAQKSAFSDVPEGHWAEGWINCANDNGLMIGVGGGKFAPEANVSKQEVATVTLRGVGYDDNLPGEWPADYIAKSQEVHTWLEDEWKDGESLFDYVQKIDGTAATRAEMAAIVNYCLELYRVEYVGDQTAIAGVSNWLGVDSDGYAYVKRADTNEKPTVAWWTDLIYSLMGENTTLLWDVFDAWTVPDYEFAEWQLKGNFPLLPEAAGWGYEDFDEYGFDELVFSGDYVENPKSLPFGEVRSLALSTVSETAVASDYYIFDQYLDGELWQLSSRYAMLTMQYNKKAYNKMEALFAEMLTDVEYVGENDDYTNADVYTYDCPVCGEVHEWSFDYDDVAHLPFAIVDSVKKGDIATVDAKSGYGEKLTTGEFCLLDDCEDHDKNYVFLKDGKFYEDASCLALNDVVYNAGVLNTTDPDGWVCLYIVISPKAATLEELTFWPDSEAADDTGCTSPDYRQVTIDGKDYWFCEGEAAPAATLAKAAAEEEAAYAGPHRESLDGGYKDGSYQAMNYDDLYDKLTDKDQDVLFAPAYAKNYAASIIFAAESENKQYGVLIDEDYDHVGTFFIDGVEFFGPDGKNTDLLTLDKNVQNGEGTMSLPPYLEMLGTLTNYFLDDEQVITEAEDVQDAFNWLKHDAGKKDLGYIAISAADKPIAIETKDGKFTEASAKAINDAVQAIIDNDSDKIGVDEFESAEGKKITEDTIIFEVTAKEYTDEETEETSLRYKSVKLGDFADYENAEFTADEFVIFAWADKDVKVLYVVNPSFAEPETIGLFDVSKANNGGGYAKFLPDGTVVKFDDNNAKDKLENSQYVYAAYQLEDDVCDNVVVEGSYEPAEDVEAGDFVVLITKAGWGVNKADAQAIIKNLLPADYVSDILTYNELAGKKGLLDKWEITDTTEFIDLAKKGASYSIGDTDKIIHSKDAETYKYILIGEDPYNVLQIVRVAGNADSSDEWTVTFDTGDLDIEIDDQTVKDGETATKPEDPEGYENVTYKDADGNDFDFATPIEEDTTITVDAEVIKVTVSYDAGEGSGAPESEPIDYGTTATEPADPTAPEGYEFKFWSKDGETEFDFSTEIKEDTELTAVYEAIEYTVTFNVGAGEGAPEPAVGSAEQAVVAPKAPTAPEGYEFTGWADKLSGGNMISFPYTPTADITLYAQYAEVTAEE